MKRFALLLMVLAAPALAPAPAAGPVAMAPAPGTPADTIARQFLAQDLAEASRAGEKPLVLIGQAPIGRPQDRQALFVQLQSARECGSGGCATTVLIASPQGWRKVLDGVSGAVTVLPTRHKGMADLAADTERYLWNGQSYANSRPVPNVNLRR